MKAYLNFASYDDSRAEDVLVVLDNSGSQGMTDLRPSRLQGAKDAVLKLLELKAKHHPGDRVGIVTFSSTASLKHGLSPVGSSFDSLSNAVRSIDVEGATNITAGLELAGEVLFGKPVAPSILRRLRTWLEGAEKPTEDPGDENRHRRLIVTSDGEHTEGRPYPIPAARRLRSQGVVIDVIGVGATPKDIDERELKRIASVDQAGTPRYCFISDTKSLIKKFERLAGHLRALESN